MFIKKILSFSLIVFLTGLFFSCEQNYTPKPKAYIRIDLPEKKYQQFDNTSFPYSFEYPVYAKNNFVNQTLDEKYWMDLDFSSFNAKLHLSYKPINDNLHDLVEDAHLFVVKHIPKASGIKENIIKHSDKNVYGVEYYIKGSMAASSYQFFLTDSTKNFLRGALYFNHEPNNDSLMPVIDFLIADMKHILETLQWN